MAGLGDRLVGAAVAPFEKGATLVQRVLGVVLLVSIVSMVVFFYLTTQGNASENEEKYSGLDACVGAAQDGCVELVAGELKYHHVPRSQQTTDSSLFIPPGVRETDALKVAARYRDVARPVEGMYLDGEFFGIQDADGKRYPASEIDAPPSYWLGLAASALAVLVVWIILMILHAINPVPAEGSRRRRD